MLIPRELLVHLPVLTREISIGGAPLQRFAAGSIGLQAACRTQRAWRSLATLVVSVRNVKGRPIGGLSTFCC